jgi:hypothetical protein
MRCASVAKVTGFYSAYFEERQVLVIMIMMFILNSGTVIPRIYLIEVKTLQSSYSSELNERYVEGRYKILVT